MAYYNTNPYNVSGYMPSYQIAQPMPMGYSQAPQPQQNQTGQIIWVQGKAGAEAYPVAPGSQLMLMDSNEPLLYVKRADATGRPMPIIRYRLVEESEESQAMLPMATAEPIDYDRIASMVSEHGAPTDAIDYEKLATMIADKINGKKGGK